MNRFLKRKGDEGESSKKSRKVAVRKYDPEYIKYSRCFAALCDRPNSDYLQLLYHCEVRWLSKGRVFNRLFERRHEVYTFLSKTQLLYVFAAITASSLHFS